MLLGDMGAEVIKIEDPDHGDDTRDWAPFVEGWSTYFLGVNRNKKSVAIDLKSDDGAALLADLIRSADVLVENFRPGALARLGFGAERARALNPRLIYCSISGYGATGPRRDLPGYDMVIQGESGLMDVTGFPETGPTKVGVAITDCLAAQYAVQGILLALITRARTGQGQVVDIALLDAAVSILGLPTGIVAATGKSPGRLGNAHPSLAPYEPYQAADGQVIVAVANPRLWSRFCRAVGLEDLEHDPRFATNSDRLAHRLALNERIGQVFTAMRVDELHRSAHRRRRPVRTRALDRRRAPRSSARRPEHARGDPGRRGVGARAGQPRQALGRAGAAARAAAGARTSTPRRSAARRGRS